MKDEFCLDSGDFAASIAYSDDHIIPFLSSSVYDLKCVSLQTWRQALTVTCSFWFTGRAVSALVIVESLSKTVGGPGLGRSFVMAITWFGMVAVRPAGSFHGRLE